MRDWINIATLGRRKLLLLGQEVLLLNPLLLPSYLLLSLSDHLLLLLSHGRCVSKEPVR